MKTAQELLDYCLNLPGAYLDYPFDDKTKALRHRGNSKVFALFLNKGDSPLLNLKCEPMQADFWRRVHRDVIPGFHMNKNHWNSVLLAGDVPIADLLAMINNSHRLTAPKRPGKTGL